MISQFSLMYVLYPPLPLQWPGFRQPYFTYSTAARLIIIALPLFGSITGQNILHGVYLEAYLYGT